jgi:hypothetical protein
MAAGPDGAGRTAERYLRAVAAQDWPVIHACVAEGIVRHGPFGDDVVGRVPYIAFLRQTMPALRGYRMDLDRVTDVGQGRVFVELRETVELDGAPVVTHEVLVVSLDGSGLVADVAIYIRSDPA